MKVGLFIVEQIHAITPAGYEVKFCKDFDGMVRLEFTKEHDENFYEHDHLGFPGGPREKLEKQIMAALKDFRERYGISPEQPEQQ